MYQKRIWVDRFVTEDGEVAESGTPLSATNLNQIENELENLSHSQHHSTSKKELDDYGVFKVIELTRHDGTLYCKSELLGVGPLYNNRVETYYSESGLTITKTINYTRTYNEDELLISEVIT